MSFRRKKKPTGFMAQVTYVIAWVRWVAEFVGWIADSLVNFPAIPVKPGNEFVETDEQSDSDNK